MENTMENTKNFAWYYTDGNIAPRENITEVTVISSYRPNSNDVEWMFCTDEMERLATAYVNGTRLTVISSVLTKVPARMFFKFLALESITGLSAVTDIGESAFCYTPNIIEIDIDPTILESIGASAFRMSSAEDKLDLSEEKLKDGCKVGDKATRYKRWGDGLAAIKAVSFPRTVFFDVPNLESQYAYNYLPFVTVDGNTMSVAEGGCTAFALYHMWNAIYAGTAKQYDNFAKWFKGTLNRDGLYPDKIKWEGNVLFEQIRRLGWECDSLTSITSSTQLEYIVNELDKGFPVDIRIHSVNISGVHSIVIVGCDAESGKLAVADSAVLDNKGVISWLRFEDIFSAETGDGDGIYTIRISLPVLAPGSSWFTQGKTSVKRVDITEIEIVNSENKEFDSGTVSWDATWDASVNKSVTAYVKDHKLTLVSNDVAIWANPDSSFLFCDSGSDKFTNLVKIDGAELLNTRNVKTLQSAFAYTYALQEVDVSNWDTSSCTTMQAMFQLAYSLKKLDLSKWDVSKVTNLSHFVRGHPQYDFPIITTLGDISNWDTSAVTTVRYAFYGCHELKELDLSGWDMSNVTDVYYMLGDMPNLERLSVSATFPFTDSKGQSCSIAAPPNNLPYATGYWQDLYGKSYALDKLADNPTRVYYASAYVVAGDDNERVSVKNGTLRQIAIALRYKNGNSDAKYYPSEFADEVLAL